MAPNGVAYAAPAARQGVLPRLLAEILGTRIMVKAAMKRAPASAKARPAPLRRRCTPSAVSVQPQWDTPLAAHAPAQSAHARQIDAGYAGGGWACGRLWVAARWQPPCGQPVCEAHGARLTRRRERRCCSAS